MRFMVIVKATKESEPGILPRPGDFAAMGKFNTELVKAGVLFAAEGPATSSKGARVRFSGDKRTFMSPNGAMEIEIRTVSDAEDFGDAFTPNPEIEKIKIR